MTTVSQTKLYPHKVSAETKALHCEAFVPI